MPEPWVGGGGPETTIFSFTVSLSLPLVVVMRCCQTMLAAAEKEERGFVASAAATFSEFVRKVF